MQSAVVRNNFVIGNAQYYLSPTGNDNNPGTSAALPWRTNGKAADWILNHMFNGRVILSYAQGTYTDALNIAYFSGRELRITNGSATPENYGTVIFSEPIVITKSPVVYVNYITVSKVDTTAESTALLVAYSDQVNITGFNSIGLGLRGIQLTSCTRAIVDAASSRLRNKTYCVQSYGGYTQIAGVSTGSSGNTYTIYARQGNHTATNAAGGASFGTPVSGGRNAAKAEGGRVTDFAGNDIIT